MTAACACASSPAPGLHAPGLQAPGLHAFLDAPAWKSPVLAGGGLAALPGVLARAHAEVQALLGVLGESRAALAATAAEKLQPTSAKLREVTSATETAAADILDALDRTQGLVDELEAADGAGDRARAAGARARLRDELFGMMGALQFQDITTQQLAHAAGLLGATEARLQQIAALFDPAAGPVRESVVRVPDPRTYDPHATTERAGDRQALADAIFVRP